MAGEDDEVFTTRNLNVTPKKTEQHFTVRRGKSEAVKDCGRVKPTVEANYIELNKTSRGLSATAELLVIAV